MRTLATYPSWAGPSSSPSQPLLGTSRRPTAAPLRLFKLQPVYVGMTHQSSAPTETHEDRDAMETAMRATKPGNGTSSETRPNSDGNKTPAQLALVEAEALKKEFLKVKEEVSKYKELCEINQQQKDEIDRLQQSKAELESKLTTLLDEAESLRMQSLQAKKEMSKYKGLEEEKAAMEAKLAEQLDEQERMVELARMETAEPLKRQLEDLLSLVAQREEQLTQLMVQHQLELQAAVEKAMREAEETTAGPLQQQLEELSMQLQNSQAQLDRLGEAVETAEAEKMVAVQALRDENKELLLALEGATRRLANVVYPPGSLPAGMTVTTRLEGNPDLDALVAQQGAKAADDVSPLASTVASSEVELAGSTSQAQDQPVASVTPPKPRAMATTGFLGWLFGVFRVSLYQVLGALLLYYAASILRGMPPELNAAFGVGCVVVCTLMSWTSHLLFPRFSA